MPTPMDTPLVDAVAFSTGNAFVVLHSNAQKIERQLRDENAKLREQLRAVVIAYELGTLTDRKILMARNALD